MKNTLNEPKRAGSVPANQGAKQPVKAGATGAKISPSVPNKRGQ